MNKGKWHWRRQVLRHIWKVLRHKGFLILAARRVSGGVPLRQLISHDWSKFSKIERFGYTWKFFGDGDFGEVWIDQYLQDEAWKAALRHHYRNNPHHWQYWCDDHYTNPLRMPRIFVREMIADWMAASRCYSGSWPQGVWPWLEQNWSRMVLHPSTRMEVMNILRHMGISVPMYKGDSHGNREIQPR